MMVSILQLKASKQIVYIVSFIVVIFTILNIHAYLEWWFATLGKLPDLWACIHIEEI